MFVQDLDDDERLPQNASLEERAVYGLEMSRRSFYWNKRNYLLQKEGGGRYNASLSAYGLKTAQDLAENTEKGFRSWLETVFLTEDGETTDPRYPVDKMINYELRRIRGAIIASVTNFFYIFSDMLPDDRRQWTSEMLYCHLDAYKHRYVFQTYDDINTVIPNKKMPARTCYELECKIDTLADTYCVDKLAFDFRKEHLITRLRDELIEFLLQELPYNNKRLEAQQLAKDIDKYIEPEKKEDDKPVVH